MNQAGSVPRLQYHRSKTQSRLIAVPRRSLPRTPNAHPVLEAAFLGLYTGVSVYFFRLHRFSLTSALCLDLVRECH